MIYSAILKVLNTLCSIAWCLTAIFNSVTMPKNNINLVLIVSNIPICMVLIISRPQNIYVKLSNYP